MLQQQQQLTIWDSNPLKVCVRCKEAKPLSEYYKNPRMADRLHSYCKPCNKESMYEWKAKILNDPDKAEAFREKQRLWSLASNKREVPKEVLRQKWKETYSKFPEKFIARVYSAKLVPEFEGAERHHWSYRKEHQTDIIWCYRKHHMKAHRFIEYDQTTYMYKRKDTGELLDTKEKHEEYITYCINHKS